MRYPARRLSIRIAFTGDAFFSYDKTELRHNLIYRNDVRSGDHLKSIRNILEMEPAVIAPGHGEPFLVTREMARAFEGKMKKQDAFFRELIADPDTDMGLDPSWVQIYPYQAVAVAGQPCRFEIRVRNHRPRPVDLQVALSLPNGWRCQPSLVKLTVPAGGSNTGEVEMTIPADWAGPFARKAIAADVVADGRYLGQITEAVVDIRRKS